MTLHRQLPPESLLHPRLLSASEQQEYLSLMQLGAPPLLACQRVGVRAEDVQVTTDNDDTFAERLEFVEQLLSRNVQSALYKAAMGGSVYAQANYLRQCRPPKKTRANDDFLDDMPSMEDSETRTADRTRPAGKRERVGWRRDIER